MLPGLGGSNISSRNNKYQMTGNISRSQAASLPVFNITNPQTTYAAFSGSAPHQTSTYTANTSTAPSTTPSTTSSTLTLTNKSGFANLGSNSQVISTEQTVAAKIKNDTKNVEQIAIGFITILILIFLLAVITYIKNAKSSS